MNTIYDGTFVLGNTSATTYQAGPGISITQPSEGTVRISNDETVLFSSSAGTSAVTLNESFENFESIKLVHNTQVEEFWKPKSGDGVRYWHHYGTMAQGVYKIAMVHLAFTDATHITNTSAKSLNFSLTGTSFTASVYVNDTYALNTIRKVIGINRISGSNT